MFQALLKDVVDNSDGGVASLLMDFEGIAVDSYQKPGAAFDITTIGAEFSVVIKSIQRATEMLDAGDPAEVTVTSEKVVTVFRVLSDTYFVALALSPDANVGKGRFLLRTKLPELLKELT